METEGEGSGRRLRHPGGSQHCRPMQSTGSFKKHGCLGPTPKDSNVIVGDEACALGFLQAPRWLTCVTCAEKR